MVVGKCVQDGTLMTLLLHWTCTGVLWALGAEVSPHWPLPPGLYALRRELDRWYHRRPAEDELLPSYDAEGAELASRVQSVTGIVVQYRPIAPQNCGSSN